LRVGADRVSSTCHFFLPGAHVSAARHVLGARVPIILTSRADSVRSRMASCAAAVLYADARRRIAPLPKA
jgi:phosphate acetyltransferase